MRLRVSVDYRGVESCREFEQDRLVIGRPDADAIVDLDLSPDNSVSRQHAVLECRDEAVWLTDLGSLCGTQVNGRNIKEQGASRIQSGDMIRIGETQLCIHWAVPAPRPSDQTPAAGLLDSQFHVLLTIADHGSAAVTDNSWDTVKERRLALLCDLPLQFARQTSVDALLSLVIERMVQIVPAARRGAVLLCPESGGPLLLNAYVSDQGPTVSMTLAQQALRERRTVVWRRQGDAEPTASLRRLDIQTGIYAPLFWQERPLGVLCVDTPDIGASFSGEDLHLVASVAQYAAVAIANHRLQHELRRNSRLLERLLTSFSPRLRSLLMERARQGRLQLGGENSEVTLLLCDLCGFTRTSASMEPSEIVEMLNAYLESSVEIIFQHDGTVDKYIGDAVLAVFGSPEPDPQQCEKALRAALEIQENVGLINQKRAARGKPVCPVAVGVHCGEVFHGFIGTADRLEFTVIGDVVNRTSRYCAGAGAGGVLVSPQVFQRVFHLVDASKSDITSKEGDLSAYRVKSLRA